MRLPTYSMNSPIAKFSPSLLGAPTPLMRVDRICHELRRGGVVIIKRGAKAKWVMASEAARQPAFALFQATASGQPDLVVTGQRAKRLGFDVQADETTFRLTTSEPLNADQVCQVADPTCKPDSKSTSSINPTDMFELTPTDSIDGAAIVLMKQAGLLPSAIVTDCTDDTDALTRDVLCIDESDIREGLRQQAVTLRRVSEVSVPLEDAELARIIAFRPSDGELEHLAIVVGEPDLNHPVLIRFHSECFTGDLLGSLRCDCGHQLRGAIALMANAGSGILLYLAQEGRGIGLINKLRAYQLQDGGRDTVDANLDLGFEEDERDYQPAVEMLKQLNVRQVRVLTNNPRKVNALSKLGVNVVERVAHVFPANHHNRGYLYTKGTRGGHLLNLGELTKKEQ